MYKLIRELHKVFDYINKTKYNNQLIEPVITVQKNENKKKIIWGHCTCLPIWVKKVNDKEQNFYEINITHQSLSRPYEETIGTLIHEIAHMANLSLKNIKDTNPRSQKHSEAFKTEAEKLGLIVENAGRTGWSQTSVSESLLDEIHNKMDLDVSAFAIYLMDEYKETKAPKPRRVVHKYKCKCCGKEIKSVEEELHCICSECEEEYEKVSK